MWVQNSKKIIGLYKEIIFMNSDMKFLNIEWRTPYPLTNFEDRLGLCASVIFLDSNMCSFLFICTLASSQILVVNWRNYLFILFHYSRFVYSPDPIAWWEPGARLIRQGCNLPTSGSKISLLVCTCAYVYVCVHMRMCTYVRMRMYGHLYVYRCVCKPV